MTATCGRRGKSEDGRVGQQMMREASRVPHRRGIRRWGQEEIDFLTRSYATAATALLVSELDRPMVSIWAKAKSLGLVRDPATSGRSTPGDNPYERLTLEDRIYIAGLLDGEGTIAVMRREGGRTRNGKVRTPSRITIVSIANTDRHLVKYVMARAGGRIYSRLTSRWGKKAVHTWQIGGSLRCKHFLSVIYPHMHEAEKRRRARDVIKYTTPSERRMSAATGEKCSALARGFSST